MANMAARGLFGWVDPRWWGGSPSDRPSPFAGSTLGRAGALEVRLSRGAGDVRTAQRLRYRVFYDEMSARPDTLSMLSRRDRDAYDAVCDHLVVVDHAAPASPGGRIAPKIVGTYRLLRQETAERHGGFYSAGEFDLGPLIAAHPDKRFLELGRSCVLPAYRSRKVVELLWHGIWTYVLHHRIDVMIGCASLEGTDPSRHALPLAFLDRHRACARTWPVRALPARFVAMDRMPPEAIEPKAALQALPPLIKGYLRLGATFAEGAVVDRRFGTTDVLVILPVTAISQRYVGHFGPSGERYAA